MSEVDSWPDYQQIYTDIADRILTITMNRPERLNAFTATMMWEMIDAFERADANDDVRVVIVTGAGRGFCAGADLGSGGDTFDAGAQGAATDGTDAEYLEHLRDGGGRLTLKIFESTKPVIAAINGAAVGVGVTMTLPMDIRLASTSARFGFVFARRGIVPEACSSWFLPRVVGINQALEWSFSGRVFGADEALAGRLVRSIHPGEDLLGAARAVATEIAGNTSAISVAMTRQMMWRMLGADHPMEAHKIDSRAIRALGRNADAYEGVGAFLEKRPAEFRLGPSTDMPDFYPWWEPRPFA